MNINYFKMSGLKVMSVQHCTGVFLPFVTIDGEACGEPIGWCPNDELGEFERRITPGGLEYVGLRIYNQKYGECWGHALKQHLSGIFGVNEGISMQETPIPSNKEKQLIKHKRK